MFRNGGWRLFLAGALCGMIFMAVVGAASIWWKPRPQRSAEDNAIYDNCLMERSGNTVACDAMMRLLDRERAAEKRNGHEGRGSEIARGGFQQARGRAVGNEKGLRRFATERRGGYLPARPSGWQVLIPSPLRLKHHISMQRNR